MTSWCLEHPWMTLFVAMTLASSFGKLVRIRIVRRPKVKP